MERISRVDYYYDLAEAVAKAPHGTGEGIIAVKDHAIVGIGNSNRWSSAIMVILSNLVMSGISCQKCVFYSNYLLSKEDIRFAKEMKITDINQKTKDLIRNTKIVR